LAPISGRQSVFYVRSARIVFNQAGIADRIDGGGRKSGSLWLKQ
jgi:hypothetical protein